MLDSKFFWIIFFIITTSLDWFVLKIILDEILEKRKSNLFINIGTLIMILITIIFICLHMKPIEKLLIGMVLGLILYNYSYNDNVIKISLICFMFWMAMVGLEALSISIVVFFNSLNAAADVLENNIFKLEVTILSKLLLIGIIPIIKGYRVHLEIKSKEFIYIMIPIVTNIISIVLILSFKMSLINDSSIQNLIMLLVSILLLMSSITLIIIVGKIIKSNSLKLENEIMKEKIESQYRHYLEIQKSQMKVRKLYHDLNNHLLCIENMEYNTRNSNEYIENLKAELKGSYCIKSSGNMILDIIIKEKMNICNDNNINFFYDINFSKCNFIEMIDVCSIFSNLLDNAIEASNKIDNVEKRNIRIIGNIVNSFFVIKCENYKLNKITKKKNKIVSDKKDKFLHGIGIESIKNSVQKYNGNLVIDTLDNNFVVHIYIPLR